MKLTDEKSSCSWLAGGVSRGGFTSVSAVGVASAITSRYFLSEGSVNIVDVAKIVVVESSGSFDVKIRFVFQSDMDAREVLESCS